MINVKSYALTGAAMRTLKGGNNGTGKSGTSNPGSQEDPPGGVNPVPVPLPPPPAS